MRGYKSLQINYPELLALNHYIEINYIHKKTFGNETELLFLVKCRYVKLLYLVALSMAKCM